MQEREDLTLPGRGLLLWHFSVHHQAVHAICSPARSSLQDLGVFLELQLLTGIKTKYFTQTHPTINMEALFPPGWYLPTQNLKRFCLVGPCVFVVINKSEFYAIALRLPGTIF